MTLPGQIASLPGERILVGALTVREREVLALVADGRRNREIAHTLRISIKTVEYHLNNAFDKLGAGSRTEAVVRAWQAGMLQLAPGGAA